MKRRTIRVGAAALAVTASLAGCQRGGEGPASSSSSSPPHGYVEGAEETAEQQSRLVLADAGTGAVRVLDLITGGVTRVGDVPNVRDLATDGRFAFVGTDRGAHVVDAGAWMVDHGDHVHYYRTKIRSVGDIQGPRPRHIRSDPAVTAVTFNDGTTQMFERPQLEDGAVGEGRPVAGAAKSVPVIPYEEHLLVPGAGVARDTVEIRDREGALTASVDAKCPQPRGDAVTRRGVIFGCADGALLVTAKDGRFDGEKIPYGRPVADSARPHDFRHRSGSTTLTATAGGDAVWILDVTKRTWKLVKTGPVVAVNTAGEGAPLLALTSNGVLQAIDPVTAKVVADTELLTGRKPGPHAVIEVDTNRAYLNDATGRKIYEIDYNDNLRLARTFPVDITPSHMVETGR